MIITDSDDQLLTNILVESTVSQHLAPLTLTDEDFNNEILDDDDEEKIQEVGCDGEGDLELDSGLL